MSRPVVCGIEASTPHGVAQVAGNLAAKLGATVVLTTALEQPRLAGSHPQKYRPGSRAPPVRTRRGRTPTPLATRCG